MSVNEKLVVNGVLCYISSARSTYTDQTLLSICQSFYSCEKVTEAKKILFSATGETLILRRGEGKLKAELGDIIAEFRKIDRNGLELPTFVADSFSSMPPASGFEVLSEHLVSLLSEIGSLKQQVTSLTEHVEAIKDTNVTDIKEDLYDIKTVLFKKNSVSTAAIPLYSDIATHHPVSRGGRMRSTSNGVADGPSSNNEGKSSDSQDCAINRSNRNIHPDTNENLRLNNSLFSNAVAKGKDAPTTLEDTVGLTETERSSGQWKTIDRRRKKKEVITGQKKMDSKNCTIKGIGKTLDVYIGRCDASVTSELITEYIESELKVGVVGCLCVSADQSSIKSFKVTVQASDRDKLLEASLWPENVCVRKYFKPKNHGRKS